MRMLQAGGVEVMTDGIRRADAANPDGYLELERVKHLDKGETTWLGDARGRAVKVVSWLLTYLPETFNYQVIFMERELREVLASQNRMLADRGEAAGTPEDDARMIRKYQDHLATVHRFMASRHCFSTLRVSYARAVEHPGEEAARINAFLGGRLDVVRMSAIANPSLYRNRAG
jgi:hypothetical protein